ncbi:NEQ074 [Nanoarchaeum equitans Kin4-M]|uniref:NEQ074 n=1 Tax=Nanoarchaeum equitans (strain Kin4-M) TaxID=228908 RepID=Q74N68_NANEQ|nr:NEQ074 [Nanoarchaeum equitans Kin4-M]
MDLSIKGIIYVKNKPLLNVDLEFTNGFYKIVGPNGSGKTTLLKTIAGFPEYKIDGHIIFNGEPIHGLPLYERAKKGIFYLSQVLPNEVGYLKDILYALNIKDPELDRFRDKFLFKELSGGESRIIDFLITKNLNPKVLLLDEVETHLDKNNLQKIIDYLKNFKGIAIIVTHTNVFDILNPITIDITKFKYNP